MRADSIAMISDNVLLMKKLTQIDSLKEGDWQYAAGQTLDLKKLFWV